MLAAGIDHAALIYDSDEEYVEALAPYLREGLAAGQPVLAITSPHNVGLLEEALGDDAQRVQFFDSFGFYENPVRAVAGYDTVLEELRSLGAVRVRAIGEVPFDNPDHHASWTRYEAVAHALLAQAPLDVVCPYDARRLPEHVVEGARRTHHQLWEDGTAGSSAVYVEPLELLRTFPETPVVPATPPALDVRVYGDSAAARLHAEPVAVRAGLVPGRVSELLVVVTELVSNAVLHGGGWAELTLWGDAGRVVCRVRDQGPGISDPLAGFRLPSWGPSDSGMGLWLVRQLARDVAVTSSPQGTTVVAAISNY